MTKLDKPVVRKTEADTPHGVNPNLVITVYPRGVIGIREHRRPLHTEKRTTAGNLYQELTIRAVLKCGRLEKEYRKTMTRKDARARARKECGL